MKERSEEDKQEIIAEALDRFENASDSWSYIYEEAVEDVKFVDDDEDGQWSDQMLKSRANRPCLTFDKLSTSVDRVIGGQLSNMPSVKIRAAEEGDEDIAEVYQGLIRQIDQRGIQAIKTAFKFAVKGGSGCFLVDHVYIDDVSLDQDILIREVKNPFSVLIDPIIQAERTTEARFGFLFQDMERKEFDRLYPDQPDVSESEFLTSNTSETWITEDYVRVADYYRIVLEESTLVQLSDGRVLDLKEVQPVRDELNLQGITLGKTRKVQKRKLERSCSRS